MIDTMRVTWRALPAYVAGCVAFSVGAKFFIDSGLGVDPLDVMVLGIVQHTGLTIGVVAGAVAIVFLAVWGVWNRRIPPISPFVTNFLIGSLIDLWNLLGIEAWTQPLLAPWPMLLSGLVLAAYGSALIIMSGIGIRIMDLVAITMVRKWGLQFFVAKSILELFFIVSGYVLGGPIGIGTVMFLIVVGPLTQPLMWANARWLGIPNRGLPEYTPARVRAEAEEEAALAPRRAPAAAPPAGGPPRPEEGGRLRERALEGAFWASLDGWGRQAVSLLVFVALARLLTPVEVGLFAMVAIVLAAVHTLLDEGLTEVLVQRDDLDDVHLDTAFWLVAGIGAALCAAVALAAPAVAALFGQPALAPYVAAAAGIPFLAALSGVHQAVLRRRMDYRLLTVRSAAGVVAGGAVGIWMAWEGWGVWALLGQQAADRLVGGAVLWIAAGWRPRPRVSARHARDLMPYSTYLAGTRIVNFSSKQVDRYLIGLLMGPAVLGVYSMAARVADTAYALLAQGLSNVGMSAFSRLQKQPEKLREALLAASELSNLVALPAFLGLCAAAPALVETVFGPAWTEAGPILSVLALLGVPAMFSTFCGALMRALGTTRLLLWVLIASALANIVVVAATVSYGLYAVAVGILVRNLCFIPLYLVIQHRLAGVHPIEHLARVVPVFAAASLTAVAAWLVGGGLEEGGWPAHAVLAAQVGTGILAYPVLLALIAPRSLGRLLAEAADYRRRTSAMSASA
jgi:PST family polysaccharide transporter